MSWGSANATFGQIADVLIAGEATAEVKTSVCSHLVALFAENDWDPNSALEYYADEPAIVEAFRENDIFLTCAAETWDGDYRCALDDGHDGDHDDGEGHTWRDHTPAVLLEDARTLAKALLDRLRDFVSDDTVFGEGISWETLPDWVTGEGPGRALWAYGAGGSDGGNV